ncbi:MAG: winged helix-turn-helix domain-containing protein [Halioglobus sp.]
MEKHSVMVIEDDTRLACLVSEYLEQHEFNVNVQHSGESALENFSPNIDLVILDLMMPSIDGLTVCRNLREQYDGAILMLTAKGSDIDQVVGLEIGADDYVVKPVEPRVLLARARALLRRKSRTPETQTALRFGDLSISKATQQVLLDEIPIPLTTQEFDLLWLLVSHAGEVLSRADIYQSLRGLEYDGLDRTVDVCVSHLRKKLRDDGEQPIFIKTVWGKGYLFAAQRSLT